MANVNRSLDLERNLHVILEILRDFHIEHHRERTMKEDSCIYKQPDEEDLLLYHLVDQSMRVYCNEKYENPRGRDLRLCIGLNKD